MAEQFSDTVVSLLNRLRSNKAQQRALEAVVESPEMLELAERMDRQRAERAKQMLEARRRHLDRAKATWNDKACKRRIEELVAKVEKLRADLNVAEQALASERHLLRVNVSRDEGAALEIERTLNDQMDYRLFGYRALLGYVESSILDARNLQHPSALGPEFRDCVGLILVNSEEVNRAMEILRRTDAQSRSVELAGLTFSEVTRQLSEWCGELRNALEKLGVATGLYVDPKTAEVVYAHFLANGEASALAQPYKGRPTKE